ncbi:sporulation integral membrane protein YlbJ [uncultured Clostridium sp.]|uniref:sporulation integral membrane protein YlbJ n=1 Tax=uncultured Clostridium sp. TaxID=59620 RepID=UPI0028E56C7D|nr:sporulation integral membrane protein YlbJ [uncultured Clostridium sp.]
MILLIYLGLILGFALLYFLLKDKSILIILLCSFIIINFITNPDLCIKGSLLGSQLFFYKVFPSIFPFLIITNIIMSFNGIDLYSKIFGKVLCYPLRLPKESSFVLLVSLLCGYPLGAKYSCELYERKIIDYKTCSRLINIASNASPLFIVGSVGVAMLNDKNLGYILLLGNYLSCFLISFIIRGEPLNYINKKKHVSTTHKIKNFGDILKNSIENSINTSLSIGGFIIIFTIISNILKNSIAINTILKNLSSLFKIDPAILEGLTFGMVEMTNGCNIIASTSLDNGVKVLFIGFLLGFSGICIIWQCGSFMSKHGFSLWNYSKYKIFQGIFSSICSYVLYKLILAPKSLPTFSSASPNNINSMIFLAIIFILILPNIIYRFKKQF